MTTSELRKYCKKNKITEAFYCKGELFVNKEGGETVFNEYLERESAEDLCENLGLTLIEM